MLFDCLSKVADPRRRQGRRYQLEYILMFSVLAMLCGATSYPKIQRFMNAHRERLNECFGLAWKRAPAHTSIRSLLQALDAQELEQAFRVHSQRLLDSRADADTPPAEWPWTARSCGGVSTDFRIKKRRRSSAPSVRVSI